MAAQKFRNEHTLPKNQTVPVVGTKRRNYDKIRSKNCQKINRKICEKCGANAYCCTATELLYCALQVAHL